MKKKDFYTEIKQALELSEKTVTGNTPIQLTSLQTLAVIAFADDNFRRRVKIADLKDVRTISDLMAVIGMDNFND
jgi:acyl carrier protein